MIEPKRDPTHAPEDVAAGAPDPSPPVAAPGSSAVPESSAETAGPQPVDALPPEASTIVTADFFAVGFPPAATAEGRHLPPRSTLDVRFFVRLALNSAALLAAGILVIVLLGVAQRVGWISASAPGGGNGAAAASAAEAVYTCPMHPQIRQPGPGRCPICFMPLEVAAAGGGRQDEYSVTIEPAARRLANIQTAPARQRTIEKRLEAIGRIAIDESRRATISAYVAGRIERLFADYTGVEVERGDHLAVIYSPPLYAAQVEFLEAQRTLESMEGAGLASVRRAQERLAAGARQRLVELGMTADQIAQLEQSRQAQSRLTLYTPIGGTVLEKRVVEGKYVEAGEPIYEVANLGTVWLLLQLYPEDAALIRFGQRVEVEVQSLPGRKFQGRVAFVNPVVDERTRTVDVRVELLNEERLLRPGDYARAGVLVPLGQQGEVFDAELAGKWISPMHPQVIRDGPGPCPICGMDLVPTSRYGYADTPVPQPEVLVVPRGAVLMTGGTSLVYVEVEPGRFEIRPVKLGPLLGEEAVIVEGVAAGEEVAVSGNFLIDSQMQLAGKPSLIDPERAIARTPKEDTPLALDDVEAEWITGEAGRRVEQLYAAYDRLVAALAADRLPTAEEVRAANEAAAWLAVRDELSPPLRDHAAAIAEEVAHLHHQSLEDARGHFKGVSRHVLQLAAAARGEGAKAPLIHFHCNMVPGSNADWLQAERPTANPYMGSKMLRCATYEALLPLPAADAEERPATETEAGPDASAEEAAAPHEHP